MPDIFDEVEEEYRAERARRFWIRFAVPIVAVLVLAVGGVAGWQGWVAYQARQAQASAMAFLAAQSIAVTPGASPAEAAARFSEVAAQSPAGYRTLARLRAAAAQAEAGQPALARALYDQVAGDTEADGLYRDLANLLFVLHGLDEVAPDLLAARIGPLTAAGSAWRGSARELAALVELRQGRRAEAKRALEALGNDADTPTGVRERALRLARGIEG